MDAADVVIIGAGLAGLSCACHLQEHGISFQMHEASAEVGGRVATDVVEGFLLDRGFQVLLSAYPTAQRLLDYSALQLGSFYPGALIRGDGKLHRFIDPWRHPLDGLHSLFGAPGTLTDRFRIARLRGHVQAGSVAELFQRPETTTLHALQRSEFSAGLIDRFFRPFFGGIFLESELRTSSRMFEFIFRMFSEGNACLPAAGMAAIPRQLASRLPAERIHTGSRVLRVAPGLATLASGQELRAKAVILAVAAPVFTELMGDVPHLGSRGVTCLYYAADHPPLTEPILVLNGEGHGPVNNLCVPSAVAPSYAPAGAALISATVLGNPIPDHDTLEQDVRAQMVEWFGEQVRGWHHLRTYRIAHALPEETERSVREQPVRLRPGLYVCGDHRVHASIEGALVSGQRVAEAVREDLA